ncbi:MAG: hypothetical protein GX803_00590 [Lentisphaerae bacterium]|nr:hypothetical protein [Lentisphaerota bacterium]
MMMAGPGRRVSRLFNLNNSSTWMKTSLLIVALHDVDIWIEKLFFIPVALRRDDSNPSAALFGARRLSNQLRPACLASGPDLSRELSRLERRGFCRGVFAGAFRAVYEAF